jgi:hypothetical protein
VPVKNVIISGPTKGIPQHTYTFTATLEPGTVTLTVTYTWQATEQEQIITHISSPSDVISLSWTAPGLKTIDVMATNAVNLMTGKHAIMIEQREICLPLVLRSWIYTPCLVIVQPINNPEGRNDYTLHWSYTCATLNTVYTLQQAITKDFGEVSEIYRGPGLSYTAENREAGRHWYRANACERWKCSAWSEPQGVDVLWEFDPNHNNDTCCLSRSPLVSGKTYYGYPNDTWDCFHINVNTGGEIVATLSDYDIDGGLLGLLPQDCSWWLHYISAPGTLTYTLLPGPYHICVYTPANHHTVTPYVLEVVLP